MGERGAVGLRRLVATVLPLRAMAHPWFGPLSLALLLGVLAMRASAQPVSDPDVPWLGALGRQVIATGSVPRVNGWSFAAPESPWVAHEWALSVVYYLALVVFGPWGAVVLGAVGAAITVSIFLRLTVLRTHRTEVGVGLVFISVMVLREAIFSPRPAGVILGLPMALGIIVFGQRMTLARGAIAVAVTGMWANLHGSFVLGPMLAWLAVVVREDSRALRAKVALGCSLMPLCNPYGVKLYGLVMAYAVGGERTQTLRGSIAEFQPLWAAPAPWGDAVMVCATVLMAVFVVREAIAKPRSVALVSLGLTSMAVVQARQVTVALTLGVALCAPAIEALIDGLLSGLPKGLQTDSAALNRETLWRRATVLSVTAIVLGSALGRLAVTSGTVVSAAGGDGLETLISTSSARNVVVPFEASGWALWWGLGRGVRVLYDARNDCYPREIARVAFALERGERRWREAEGYGAETVIAERSHPMSTALARGAWGDGWVRTRRAHRWEEWERKVSAERQRPTLH